MTLCYNNLSVETLRKIEPWANKLAEKKKAGIPITAETAAPLTEAQILLRKIGRVVFKATYVLPPGILNVTLGPCKSLPPNLPPLPPPKPLTPEQEACINQRLAQSHVRAMERMESIWRQLEALNSYGEYMSQSS